ncbi:MAG: hypothetical protein LBI61_01950 [Puniceicoccales bacterium]|jgi:hypothetical protein|nr:hypothetical protein [Puniceicoccales bacterium]
MSTLNEIVIRIKADTSNFNNPIDAVRGGIPQFWRGNDLRFEIGIFSGENILSVENYASLSIAIRKMADDGNVPSAGVPALMQRVCTEFDGTLSSESWDDGTKEHAAIAFSSSESNVACGDHWLSVWATTDDATPKTITICAGIIRVLEVGGGDASVPPDPIEVYYTADACDGKFIPLSAIDADPNLGTSNGAIPSQNAVKSYVDAKAMPGEVGEANTASNVGEGVGIFKEKSGSDLRFRSLKAGDNVSISADSSEVTISAASGGGMANPMTDPGDIIVGGTSGAATQLAMGAVGQILKVESGGLAWSDENSTYELPVASTDTLGGIIVDGSTISVNQETYVASAIDGSSYGWLPDIAGTETIAITLGASGEEYISPDNGWIYVAGNTTATNGNYLLKINGDENPHYICNAISYSSSRIITILCPIAKNTVFTLSFAGVSNTAFKFIQAKGA